MDGASARPRNSPSSTIAKPSRVPAARPPSYLAIQCSAKPAGGGSGTRVKRSTSGSLTSFSTSATCRCVRGSSSLIVPVGPEDPADARERDQRKHDREQDDEVGRVQGRFES